MRIRTFAQRVCPAGCHCFDAGGADTSVALARQSRGGAGRRVLPLRNVHVTARLYLVQLLKIEVGYDMVLFRRVAYLIVSAALISGSHLSLAESQNSGKAAFLKDCAVCPGSDAKGRGAFTSMLRVPPPDLTTLSRLNGGEFPAAQVRRTLAGINIPGAHGTGEMPIWGRRWREDGHGSAGVNARASTVMAYLRAVQEE